MELLLHMLVLWSPLAPCGDAQQGQQHLSVALGQEMELWLSPVLLVLFYPSLVPAQEDYYDNLLVLAFLSEAMIFTG